MHRIHPTPSNRAQTDAAAIPSDTPSTSGNDAVKLPTWLSIAKFAAHLGLSESTVRGRLKEGCFRVAQPGGKGTRVLIATDSIALQAPKVSAAEFTADVTAPQFAPAARRSGPVPRWQKRISRSDHLLKENHAQAKKER